MTLTCNKAPEYVRLFSAARRILEVISEPAERLRADKWYADLTADGHDFETYEPDEIPNLIAAEQVGQAGCSVLPPACVRVSVCVCVCVRLSVCVKRLRDTGNAFDKFDVEVLNGRTRYTDALSGLRQPGRLVGTWLERGQSPYAPVCLSVCHCVCHCVCPSVCHCLCV